MRTYDNDSKQSSELFQSHVWPVIYEALECDEYDLIAVEGCGDPLYRWLDLHCGIDYSAMSERRGDSHTSEHCSKKVI